MSQETLHTAARRAEQDDEIDQMMTCIDDCMEMLGRLKRQLQISDNIGHTPDGKVLRLTELEERGRTITRRMRAQRALS